MRLAIQPDTLTERVGLAMNLVPVPLVETQIALVSARAIAAAAELGVFSALVKEPLTAAEIASDCQLSPRAVEALAGALTATDYLRYRNGRYQLSPKSRKWLAAQGAWSLFDYMPHLRDVWEIVAHMEDFLRTGEALEIHSGGLTAEQWSRYQNAMRALAAISATEAAARLPVRTGSTRMLDIGGSHGY